MSTIISRVQCLLLTVAHHRYFHRSHWFAELIYLGRELLKAEHVLLPVFLVLITVALIELATSEH